MNSGLAFLPDIFLLPLKYALANNPSPVTGRVITGAQKRAPCFFMVQYLNKTRDISDFFSFGNIQGH